MRFLVGARSGSSGNAEGIGVLQSGDGDNFSAAGPLGMLPTPAAATPGSPSWVTWHPSLDVVYAALEGDGTVQAYRRASPTTFVPLGGPVEAGSAVCHVAVSPDGAYLLAACWGDGRVVRIGLDAAGRPASRTLAPAATDPYTGASPADDPDGPSVAVDPSALPDLAAASRALREAAGEEYAHLVPEYVEPEAKPEAAASEGRVSRAHESIFLPGGRVATTDLGFDLVRFWRPVDGGLRASHTVALPEGSGPRHAVLHPSGHLYVLTELSREVFVLAPDREGRWSIISGVQLVGSLDGDSGAELSASRDGETLYAGVRGSDTIGVLRVRGGGEALQQSALIEAGAHWPRHQLVVDDTLLIAGQRGDEIVSRPLDVRTGIPGPVRHRTVSASPTCLVPLR